MISTPYDADVDYGPAQSDRRHVFNATFTYDLPFGKGKRWASGGWQDRVAGGWYLSGIYRAYTSLPFFVSDNTGVFGGTVAGVPTQGAIPLVSSSSLGSGVYEGVAGSGGVGTAGNPAVRGSGLNLFANPETAFKSFRRILLSQDGRQGRATYFRGPGFWNLDFRLGKQTRITERVSFDISADFFNLFNHVNLAAPSLSLSSPANFGVFTSQTGNPRGIQFGARLSF